MSVLASNIISECITHGKMSGGHYSLNRATAHGPVAETFASVLNSNKSDCLWTSRGNICISPKPKISLHPSNLNL